MTVLDQQLPLQERISSGFRTEGDRLIRSIDTRWGGRDGLLSETWVKSRNGSGDLDEWWTAYLQGDRPTRLDGRAPTRLRTVELFCGPGGLGLGFDQAASELGFTTEVAAIVDQDASAVEVYSNNRRVGLATSESVTMLVDYKVGQQNGRPFYRNDPQLLQPAWKALVPRPGESGIDVVLAGPPCQGHSSLNNRTRRNDLRNELYLTVPAIAIALKAPMVIIENVPGVVHDSLGVVETTKSLLEQHGYIVRTGVLRADRLGWPQRRSRFFLVARRAVAPLDLPDVESGLRQESALPVSWAFGSLQPSDYPEFMTSSPDFSAENVERMEWLHANNEFDLPNDRRPDCHKEGTTYNSVYGRMHPDRPAQTVTTGFFTPGRGRFIHPFKPRSINAAEAARLQGFPVSYDFSLKTGDPSRSQLGKWIGDAVPMPLGYAAGISLLGGGVITL